ncbi:co-chaperone YbbN [Avibacterium sp. 20-15]|uniref:co-chaperone YbbN n=1 Tax=unclassified Avibacterium TaxID=2685287 RepID=UPI002026DC32|nr:MULTISPECIES: co-chaperone YbbN [unclassified Avibacterium]MCW9733862.1 co-chaperone YbbN [Avibacterium sp. 20-15]URL03979.1 co-chaperone YbbN [Avibacterium sp. 20-132]
MTNYSIDVNQQNLTEILQQTQQTPLALLFYAPSHTDSVAFVSVLERYAEKYQGQFLLGKIDCEAEQMVAAQFGIQALPTTYLFKDGQALDAFQGALDENTLEQHLNLILPKEEEIKFNQALDLLANQDYEQAIPLLKEAWELSDHKNSDIALLYAETYIAMKRLEPAQEILNRIPLQDRDSRWQGLQAQIELLIKAADTPEIQQLQAEYANNKSPEIALKLALQLHQAHRNEEALDLLFSLLKQDLGALNGEIKQEFLSILAAMGNNDPMTNKYRRLLYSLLY